MDNLELRISYSEDGTWTASWLQDDEILFESESGYVTKALAGLVYKVGRELADVTGGVEKEEE